MKKFIKQIFDMWCENRWLRLMNREIDKYNRLNAKLKVQHYVVNKLIKEYNNRYDTDLRQR